MDGYQFTTMDMTQFRFDTTYTGTGFGLTVGGLSNIASVKIEMIIVANEIIQVVSQPLTYTVE